MKRRENFIFGLALFSFLFFLFHFIPNQVVADFIEDEVVIDRYPDEAVFRLENMKPGDFAYRTLMIQNNHDRDIVYTMQLENIGDTKLYNELLLQITYLDEVVFYGKLKDYKGVNDRPLSAMSEEMIEFDLKFPEELGNEFQGLRAEFILDFTARAASDSGLGGIIPETGNPIKGSGGVSEAGAKLPATATNIFTYLLIGALLVTIGGIASYLIGRKKQLNKL